MEFASLAKKWKKHGARVRKCIFLHFVLVKAYRLITFPAPRGNNHIASWCNGSTTDFDSVCLGSNPSEATFFATSCEGNQEYGFSRFRHRKNEII